MIFINLFKYITRLISLKKTWYKKRNIKKCKKLKFKEKY